MKTTLDWLGVSTFRLTVGDLVVFLDAYMDRAPGAAPVGMTTAEVDRADLIVVGHSHFDHLAGADVIALKTGARVIASNESCRVLRERGVPDAQLIPSQGGEHHRLSADVTVRVYPSLHAATWIHTSPHSAVRETGHLGLTEDERAAMRGLSAVIREEAMKDSDHGRAMMQHILSGAGSIWDGGVLVFLIETPDGSVFVQDTSGCWTGVLEKLQPDIAILATSGRPNVDGEPMQGSMAQFVAMEAELLQAKTVLLGHHDDWLPPITPKGGVDVEPIRAQLKRRLPDTRLLTPKFLDGTVLFE